jgi:hypothetical protein
MYNYIIRTTPTDEVSVHADKYDNAVREVFYTILDPETTPETLADLSTHPLLRGILHLKATNGGIGVTSAARVSEGARIGNLALTSNIVGNILGIADPEDQRKAVPELYTYLANLPSYADGIDSLNKPLSAFFDSPFKNISAVIGRARQDSELKHVLSLANNAEATMLLSQGQNGAAYLLASNIAGQSLTNDQFRTLLTLRASCTPPSIYESMPDPTCNKPGCGKTFDEQSGNLAAYHALECRGNGKDGLVTGRGYASSRHASVKYALTGSLQRIATRFNHPGLIGGDDAKGGAVGQAEPKPSDYFPLNPLADAQQAMGTRADIIVQSTYGQSCKLIDLVVTHPNSAGSTSKAHVVPGTCAERMYKRKMTWYSDRFVLTDTSKARFYPLAIETHGRIHPKSRQCIEDIIKDFTVGNKDPKDWTKKDASNYNTSLKFVLDSIGVALARVVASSIIAFAAGIGRKSGTSSGKVTNAADLAGGDQEPAEELACSQ